MRKYLNDIGVKDKDLPWNWNKGDQRSDEWKQERKKYGFDERDTWSLDYTLVCLVYERLKMYREIAAVEMDKPGLSHSYKFEGKEVVLGDAVDRILEGFRVRILRDIIEISAEEDKEYRKCWQLLGIISGSLWW